MQPITFSPLYMERVWGGRELETVYDRSLPKPNTPFGESWEMTDRPGEQSVVDHGPLSGSTLGQLWQEKREEIFGVGFEAEPHFPLLIKILDARDDLSIQVHPPAEIAGELGGEPKTEMWYIAAADPGATLYVGLKEGITQEDFQASIEAGTVDQTVHAIRPKAGDSIFIPSGRLHAIGAGLVIYEIQQNSDTTYRVFDWNRMGLDGQPRQLHVEESMSCIDFTDTEPPMDTPDGQTLASCPYFQVDRLSLSAGASVGNPDPERFSIVTVVDGVLESADGRQHVAGDFLLMPRAGEPLTATADASILQTTIPR
ncbi:class I mannose-6-phosphate isomerase [Verrucomicrobiaceae bacterium 5K15]|uniref:Class I mannose-6-phosphate isomerase n=1 Tax=Oceaniferula flava TaxID=2800421 RepID=A0AAE2VCU9_9BACT|nr:type I phosphomannose isomerase catalytic subunit [Oceaniferula flavus]MBK1853724.1 class I mannose-6-phosphate isomerase [Oceaniferula flavus]MBM1135030.1 class I mannose-6-phosphate isomerase [Oceaniferula flavus]